MRSPFSFFNKAVNDNSNALKNIFPLSIDCPTFKKADIRATFTKILTDTLERTHGIPKDHVKLLWDNCVQNESQFGLVTYLVEAMIAQSNLFLVYNKTVKVIRKATPVEQAQIEKDYQTKSESSVGVFISFKNFQRTQMLNTYSELEYYVLASFHKTVNISKAVQIKIDGLRSSVALNDEEIPRAQARSIADAISAGNDVYLDSKDDITNATPNIAPTEKAIAFLNEKRAYILDLPISYVSGVQTTGIGATGEADMRALERGLKQYFFTIIQPVLKAIFKIDVVFKSQDFRQTESALELLKTFEMVSDDLVSKDSKQEIIARYFGLDPKEEEKAREEEAKARGSSTTLNGAQVDAMQGFLEQLATGSLAPDTAVAALMVSFNLSREDADKIVLPMQNFKPKVVNS